MLLQQERGSDKVPGLRACWNLPGLDLLQYSVGEDDVDRDVRSPDLEEREARVTAVLGDDSDARRAVCLGAVHVHPATRLHHLDTRRHGRL